MSGQAKPQHPFVVYRKVGEVEVPVAFADAADEAEAIKLVQPKWPRSHLLLGGGSSGEFRAVSGYAAPLEDLQRVALLAQTGLIAATCNNTAVAAQALSDVAGIVKAGMAQAVKH